jgi:O-antigen ligase
MLFLVYSNLAINSNGMRIFSERFTYKLFEDRLPLWTFSLNFILNSDFFLVPAARDIIVSDYGQIGEQGWGAGAHNIYLEMARQLGVFAALLITFIIGSVIFKSIYMIKHNVRLLKFILSLITIYLVWGLTGNALVYDGIGFLYWLIIGQIFQNGIVDNKQVVMNVTYITK